MLSPPPHLTAAASASFVTQKEDFIRDKCRELADLGYVAFALDAFGAGHCVFGEEKDECNRALKQDRDLGLRRVLAALEALRGLEAVDGSRVGAIGYCLGGKLVLDLARAGREEVKGVVSFHGILDSPTLKVLPISPPPPPPPPAPLDPPLPAGAEHCEYQISWKPEGTEVA